MSALLPRAPEFRVNTTSVGAQAASDIAPLISGGYGIAWRSAGTAFRGENYFIRLALFDGNGVQAFPETTLGTSCSRFGSPD